MKNVTSQILLLFSISLGTAIEWMEFTLFAYLSPLLAKIFFAPHSQDAAYLRTIGIFAVSYLARPLGALIFGYVGDKTSRKKAFNNSLTLMVLSSVCLGLLPNYETIGAFAPILLLILRFCQGIAVAGEFNGSLVVLLEQFKSWNKYMKGCFTPFSAALGMVFGGLLAQWVFNSPENPYAWRFAFIISGLSCVSLYFLRTKLPEMKPPKQITQFPLNLAIKNQPRALITCFFAAGFTAHLVYLGQFFYRTLLTANGFSSTAANEVTATGQLVATLCIPLFAMTTKWIAAESLYKAAMLFAVVLSPIVMICPELGLPYTGQMLYALVNGMTSACLLVRVTEAINPSWRYTGTSVSWSLGAAVFGGSCLLVAHWLHNHTSTVFVGLYISFFAMLTYATGQKKEQQEAAFS